MAAPLREVFRGDSSACKPWIAKGEISLDLPQWVSHALAAGATHASECVPAEMLRGEGISLAAHQAIQCCLDGLPGGPCRIWTFLPRPTERDGDVLDRYMRFNAGRTSAYRARPDRITVIPAGTCVGHAGNDLVVHALHIPGPMRAAENPRQRPAWLYSEQYGPVAPAFSRAMLVGGMLLASGTASVVGERSLHAGDLSQQFAESVRNLHALAASCGPCSAWRSVRIYVRAPDALAEVERMAIGAFGSGLEGLLVAPLCREELLLEIEAVADVG